VALAALLKADGCRIYTDVDGVYDKDPRRFANAVRFHRIGYTRMLELIDGGAQVLHDRSVLLAQRYGIPIEVLSSFRDTGGTVVQ
jgi:aspartate kinase